MIITLKLSLKHHRTIQKDYGSLIMNIHMKQKPAKILEMMNLLSKLQ